MFRIIREIFADFAENNIRFVHWKSNVNLNKALMGHDDLDLLVAPGQLQLAKTVLLDHGMIEGINPRIQFPHVCHYFGNDSDSGHLVHVHLYSEIITGSSWTKSYHFPWVDHILTTAVPHATGVPVTVPHIEYALYIIRAFAKRFSLLESLFTGTDGTINTEELSYLTDRLDWDSLEEFLQSYLPALSAQQISGGAQALLNGNQRKVFFSGLVFFRACSSFRRHSVPGEVWLALGQLVSRVVNRLLKQHKKIPRTKTRFIAVTGLDASGKSSATSELKQWLGNHFRIDLIHVGRPPSAWATLPINLGIRLLRSISPNRYSNAGTQPEGTSVSLLYSVRYLALAFDRYRLATRFFKRSAHGRFVICDRYPARETGVMDSPHLQGRQGNFIVRKLAKWEKALYERIPSPDLVIRLSVPLELALARNRQRTKSDKESDEVLRLRYAHNSGLTYRAHQFVEIDTSGQFEETMKEIKKVVWDHVSCAVDFPDNSIKNGH